MASGGMVIVKYLLFFFNFIFWLSGLGLIVVGAIIKSKYGDFMKVSESNGLTSAPVFMIVIGVIVAFVGFLGCCGAIKENYCMVTTFAVLLGIIFVLEIAAGALAYAFRSKVEGFARKALEQGTKHYYDNSTENAYKKFMDDVQEEFNCCGYTDKGSYHGYSPKAPPSCYRNDTIAKDNCVKGLEKNLKDHLVVVGGVGIGIAFIQLIGILFACCLMRSIKKEYEVM